MSYIHVSMAVLLVSASLYVVHGTLRTRTRKTSSLVSYVSPDFIHRDVANYFLVSIYGN